MLIGCILFIVVTYFIALRLDNYGLRSKAKILSIYEVESTHDTDNPITKILEAKIEYSNGGKLFQERLFIRKKYKESKYALGLPIIYHKDKPESPVIDDVSIIYQTPRAAAFALIIVVVLVLVLVLIELVFF